MKILYVDDDRINLVLFEHLCSKLSNVQLHTATDVDEALSQARAHPPDMLVIDLHLSGTDGHALLGLLRQHGAKDTPAFLCTADCSAQVRQRALAEGFQDSWAKPVDVATLQQALSMHVQSPAAPPLGSTPPASPPMACPRA
jgi:CheY-like chemotaxis protein